MVRPRGLLREHWMPPGGHIDPDETPAQAGCRELVEELDIHYRPGDLHQLGCCPKDVGAGTLTLFEARCDSRRMRLGEEILEAQWVPPATWPELSMLPATTYGLQLATTSRTG